MQHVQRFGRCFPNLPQIILRLFTAHLSAFYSFDLHLNNLAIRLASGLIS